MQHYGVRNSVAKRIKQMRSARMSQDEMAELSGIPRATIQRIEAGRSHDYRTIEAIMSVLGFTPSVLWDDHQKPSNALSKTAALSPDAADVTALLNRFMKVTGETRAVVLAILFDDPALAPKNVDLKHFLSRI
jgi:transcriptional regulator with XRE-family HTH domain